MNAARLGNRGGRLVEVERAMPRLRHLWRDTPEDPGRLALDDPRVRRLIAELAPGTTARDLGGCFSLNALLEPAGVVLRVHQAFMSPRRLHAQQALRTALAASGLCVAVPLAWRGQSVLRCGARLAELEPFLDTERPAPTTESAAWLFASMGRLHRQLPLVASTVPAPPVATYAAPATLRRWLRVATPALRAFPEREEVERLIFTLRRRWIPAAMLPRHVVHGDARLGNVRRASTGEAVFLDSGFAAVRPRVHELAYALVYTLTGLSDRRAPAMVDWRLVDHLVDRYQAALGEKISQIERDALPLYMAAVPLYHCVTAGLVREPEPAFRSALTLLPSAAGCSTTWHASVPPGRADGPRYSEQRDPGRRSGCCARSAPGDADPSRRCPSAGPRRTTPGAAGSARR